MTRFVDIHDLARLVQCIGTERFMAELLDTIAADFRRWPDFDKCARVAAHSERGVIELMPVADDALYGFKYVNGHPCNTENGKPTVMAFGVLADVATGYPLLLSELTLTTAFRTAATSALAARTLARDDVRSMALIGNGAQSEFQALAFHTLLGINEIRAWDLDSAATDKLIRNLAAWPALRVVRARSAEAAVRGADIVTTVTADKTCATVLLADWLSPGMHINAVGGDCPGKTELHPDVLRAGPVFVEFAPQTRVEGDIQQMPADFPVTELWEVLTGGARGRTDNEQITIFDSVGFALEDWSALRYIHDRAREFDIGRDVDLIPTTGDPKDLFRLALPGVIDRSLRKVA